MSRRRRHAAVLALCVGSAALAAAVGVHVAGDPGPTGPARGGEGRELDDEQDSTLLRLDALGQARAAGRFGTPAPLTSRPAAGWSGERLLNPATDDWEPAVAADPHAPYVYLLTTRYGETKPCPGKCPTPFIVLAVSADGGATFGPQRPLCACKASGQFDPIIEVVPDTGHVYAVYMNGFDVVFVKSVDHGQTWSTPVKTFGTVAWTDKPVLAVSDDGQDVYVSWNGPKKGAPWAAVSHDAGATWAQTRMVDGDDRYHFAYDADVLPDGTVVFSEGSLVYPCGRGPSRRGRCGITRSCPATAAPRGATSSSTRFSRASRAWPRGAGRTSTSATRASRPTRTEISSSSTTGRR
jgi:hypothetical protein